MRVHASGRCGRRSSGATIFCRLPSGRLFADLSVFAGGWTLDAAEQVVSAELDVLEELAEKSLVRLSGERFWMLETIRAFAIEQLERSGRTAELHRRHAEYFHSLTSGLNDLLETDGQTDLLAHVDSELPNFRAAIDRSLSGGDRADVGVALAGSLTALWVMRGHLAEGRTVLEAALDVSSEPSVERATALRGLALISSLQGDWAGGERWSEGCIALSRTLGERGLEAQALATLGRALVARGESEGARLALERSFAVADAMELPRSAGMALFNLGWASLTGGELGRARAEFDDSLARFTVARWEYGITRSLTALAAVALREHSVAEAVVQLRKSLALSLRLGDLEDGVWALELYGVSRAEAAPEDAARLLGAAEAGRERLGISPRGSTSSSTIGRCSRSSRRSGRRGSRGHGTQDAGWASSLRSTVRCSTPDLG